jgi:hypothetical protein
MGMISLNKNTGEGHVKKEGKSEDQRGEEGAGKFRRENRQQDKVVEKRTRE